MAIKDKTPRAQKQSQSRPGNEQYVLWLERWFTWPLTGGVTTVLGVIAGYLGSHFDKEIPAATFRFFLGEWGRVAAGPVLFWLFTILFGCFFTGTFWAQSRSSKRSTQELSDATKAISQKTEQLSSATHSIAEKTNEIDERASTLDELVRQLFTIPPRGFLETYRDFVGLADNAYFEFLREAPTKESLDSVIRTQLLIVMQAATKFSNDSDGVRYGCNVLLYKPNSALSDYERRLIQQRLRFQEKGVAVVNLEGVLDLIVELSVASDSGPGPDQQLPRFALPIPVLSPEKRQDRARNGVLPGAPDAFVAQEEVVVESPVSLMDRANIEHFTRPVREELSAYFNGQGGAVLSFVSIPVYAPISSGHSAPICVLNIHRNRTDEKLAEKFEMLSPLLTPFIRFLGRLVWTGIEQKYYTEQQTGVPA